MLSSCGEYNKLLKSSDYEYKYEAAKASFAKGQYNRSITLLNELITILKGTPNAEESLYMLAMSYYNMEDYQTAAQTFIQYYNVYPRGVYTELARFYAGKALFLDTPEPRLDQSGTYSAIQQLQMFLEYFPESSRREEAQNMVFALQDKLVMKEYLSAKLYYCPSSYYRQNMNWPCIAWRKKRKNATGKPWMSIMLSRMNSRKASTRRKLTVFLRNPKRS